MIKITDIVLTADQITNSTDGIVLVGDVTDGYEYSDGKRAETPNYKRVTVSLPKRKLEQKSGSVKVKFKNLSGRFYFDREAKEYKLSCKADGLEVLP